MSEETFKVWISKYALTQGILEMEAKETCSPGMIEALGDNGVRAGFYHGEGKEWHLTEEGAIRRAEDMRKKKIASLKKKIKELEKMSFAESSED